MQLGNTHMLRQGGAAGVGDACGKDANNNYVTDQVNSFSYDQFGNMLTNQLQYPGNPGQDSQITYDVNSSNNRLIGYADGQDVVATADHAAGSRRRKEPGAMPGTEQGG